MMDNNAMNGNVDRLLALGYNLNHVLGATALRQTLLQGISKLKGFGHLRAEPVSDTDVVVYTRERTLPGGFRMHSDLLPLWKEFAQALCRSAAREHEHRSRINLSVRNVGLTGEILSILKPALEISRLNLLELSNNGLGRDGMRFVAQLLESNQFVQAIFIEKNEIEFGPEVPSLLQAARKHTHLQVLGLNQCGIGGKHAVATEIIPSLLRLHSVILNGNGIGSHGAKVISSCLERNPEIEQLILDSNVFNDEDATLFARSLKSNRNLLHLRIRKNNLTDAGIETLYKSVYDDQSLKSIQYSNHTCRLELLAHGQPVPIGVRKEVLALYEKHFDYESVPRSAVKRCIKDGDSDETITYKILRPYVRMKIKIHIAFQSGYNYDSNFLDGVPMNLMPRVLASLQESGKYAQAEERNLGIMFHVISSRPVAFCTRPPKSTPLHEKLRMIFVAALVITAAIAVELFLRSQYGMAF